MTRLSSEIRIDAPKEKVWAVLADLGAVSAWNPTITNSYYISESKDGVGASRHCDLPDGGFVKERATAWTPGEAFTLNIYEGTTPFENGYGSFEVKDDGQGAVVNFTLEFDPKPDAPVPPEQVERLFKEQVIPAVIAGLKRYVETGQPMPMPARGG